MRIALLSDIHANAPALRAVVADINAQGVDAVWVLGDVLGYGPLPVSCITMLDEISPTGWLMGNHDFMALLLWEGASISQVRSFAPGFEERLVAQWHANQLQAGLSTERIQRLRQLPTWQRMTPEIYIAHGAILSLDAHDSRNVTGSNSYCNASSAGRNLTLDYLLQLDKERKTRLVVVGHTHVVTVGTASQWQKPRQWVWHEGQALPFNESSPYLLSTQEDQPIILCPGSVGQPRRAGGDERAAYAILDLAQWAVYFRRVNYHYKETEAAMVPMPDSLREWLERK